MEFKSKKFNPEKERKIFAGVPEKEILKIKKSSDNTFANQLQTYNANIALAIAKTNTVLKTSADVALGLNLVIPVPAPDEKNTTIAAMACRLALLAAYPTQSKNGTEIDFELYKTIVDNVNANQNKSLDDFFNLEDSQLENIDQFDISVITSLASRGKTMKDFLSPGVNEDGSLKPESNDAFVWLIMMQTCLTLLSNHQTMKFLTPEKVKEHTEDTQAHVDAATLPPQKIVIAAKRMLELIIKVAKAAVILALIYRLSKLQAKKFAIDAFAKAGIPLTQENLDQVNSSVNEEYDKPHPEVDNLLVGQSDPNKVIIEYCFEYMEKNNGKEGKNFGPWVIYASSIVRLNNLRDMPSLTPIDVDERGKTYANDAYYDKQKEIVETAVGNRTYSSNLNDDGSRKTWNNIEIPYLTSDKILPDNIKKYLPEDLTTTNSNMHVNIMDYVEFGNQYAEESSSTNDYFMSLMKNNKYTPELICCLINWLVNQDIKGALDFLKGLKVAIRPIRFDYGRLFSDIVNGLFNQLKTRLMSWLLKKLMGLINRLRQWVAKQIDFLLNDNKFIIFCTPLVDILTAINDAIMSFAQIMFELLRDLADNLLAFEVKWEDGFIQLQGVNRNRMLDDILNSLLYALEFGKLCKYQVQAAGDKNPTILFTPESLEIVERLSNPPDPAIYQGVQDFLARHKAVSDIVGTPLVVSNFKDPINPKLQGAVSMDREYNNKSTMEVIVEYAGLCNSGLPSYNVGIQDINT